MQNFVVLKALILLFQMKSSLEFTSNNGGRDFPEMSITFNLEILMKNLTFLSL